VPVSVISCVTCPAIEREFENTLVLGQPGRRPSCAFPQILR